jgi:chitinase
MEPAKFLTRLFCAFLLLAGCSKSPAKATEPPQSAKADFKVIGYLFADGDLIAKSASVDFSKITHLNIAFINPDASGNFPSISTLTDLVKKAHTNNVKVIAAFAGGNPPQHLKELLKPAKRELLISGLLQLTKTYDLDGIDVDLEGDFVNENYEAFVVGLSAALKQNNKLMTAAVATWNSAAYSDKALALFDFINVMAYDHTGPWRKEQAGPHSTYEASEADFAHWKVNRSIPTQKLMLGLPFYAYGFGTDIAESMNYGDLVSLYPGSEKTDSWELAGKGTFYYNGIPTIKRKVAFAKEQKAGGVMIWQLLGDAKGDLSLLSTIHNATL